MTTRYVYPELFYAAGAPIIVGGTERISLRWILNPAIGLPRSLFHVWHFTGSAPFTRTEIIRTQTDEGTLLSWPQGPCAGVRLVITVPSGSIVLSAFTAASGAGHLVDQKTLVGPLTDFMVTFVGSPVASILMTGNATIASAQVLPINEFVNNPGWQLVERVGLPASTPPFTGTEYPLDPQGPVGSPLDPVSAGIWRVKAGTPDAGWQSITDRGTSPSPFSAPDANVFVKKELRPVLRAMAALLALPISPADQAEQEVEIETTAPSSIHDVAAPTAWQSRARPSKIQPLGTMLMTAGTDPFGALGLGFGTTVDVPNPQHGTVVQPSGSRIFMITVEHKVKVKVGLFGESLTFTLVGELAALYMGDKPTAPAPPAGVIATNSTPHPNLDPPRVPDGPWLEVAEVSWATPQVVSAAVARPCGYAIARGLPGGPLGIRTDERLAGGWTTFVPAASGDTEPSSSIRFSESGVPEAMPGEPTTFVYSVAAHDWFGRWSSWVSADHPRISVAPQIPSLRKVELSIEDSDLPTVNATAALEFTWDWSHRNPHRIHIRTLVHAEGTPPPVVDGSVLSVGGPTVVDRILDFSAASIDAPPSGVVSISEEALGNLRTYRVVITGLQIAFGSHPRIAVHARARASERVNPARLSSWSPDVSTTAASPIPPPPPFVPAEMWWASVPDPHEFARTTLRWAATAPLYAVYLADETALRRELDQPSADLEVSAADRLPFLRTLALGEARRAFRLVADRIPTNSLEVVLPKGSKLIHFYGVVPISSTGAEGVLPSSANSYFAVAAPISKIPEMPRLIARDQGGPIAISVEVPETRVRAGQIEIYRAPSQHRAVSIENTGPPIAVLDEASAERSPNSVRWQFLDPTPGPAWQSVFYRAVARGVTDRSRGEYGLRSLPTPAIEIVPKSLLPPIINDLRVEILPTELDHRLVSFESDITLARTTLGTHALTIQTVGVDATITTRRVAADKLLLITGASLPGSTEQPDSIFRYDPVNPRLGLFYAWVPVEVSAVIVEIRDPGGRTSSRTWKVI